MHLTNILLAVDVNFVAFERELDVVVVEAAVAVAPAVAAFARTNLIETVSNTPYEDVPEWFSKWEETKLISFTDKNGDGTIAKENF